MRTASLFLVAVLALAAPVAAQCVGTEGVDFSRVTIDQINDIPQTNVDFLVANASTLLPDVTARDEREHRRHFQRFCQSSDFS